MVLCVSKRYILLVRNYEGSLHLRLSFVQIKCLKNNFFVVCYKLQFAMDSCQTSWPNIFVAYNWNTHYALRGTLFGNSPPQKTSKLFHKQNNWGWNPSLSMEFRQNYSPMWYSNDFFMLAGNNIYILKSLVYLRFLKDCIKFVVIYMTWPNLHFC